MEVGGHLHASAALPIGYEAEWAPEPVWTRWRKEKNHITAPAGIRTPLVQPYLSHYFDWSIPALFVLYVDLKT
jgi:hypothetical protein